MAKYIVICCDGTGNEIGRTITNVLKLYRLLTKGDEQRVYYNPGVGTIGQKDVWRRFAQKARGVLGLATGYGLDDDVLGAYRFLCQNYAPGDKVWLFGFSRGAYTVRVLAAFVHVMGLLPVDQLNLAGYALAAYKDTNLDGGRDEEGAPAMDKAENLKAAWAFSRLVGARRAEIEFLGVWDTVASVIVPGGLGRLPKLQMLRYTRTNPSVKRFRHAMAIDERRRMFRLNRWKPKQPYRSDPFRPETSVDQDIKEVWFAGVHADIGGGYPERESGLSKFPLDWMIAEAREHGLLVSDRLVGRLVKGTPHSNSDYVYVAPDPAAKMHQSMTAAWRPLEWLPKHIKLREWKRRWGLLGLYLPLSEPRAIPDGAMIHGSVRERMEKVTGYKPVNLPTDPTWI